jgi:hypothetical protein
MAATLGCDTIEHTNGTSALSIDSNGFASGIMVNAGRQSLASSNGYTWTGIPSTARHIILVYRLYFTQSSLQTKSTIMRVGNGSIVTSGYEDASSYQDSGSNDGVQSDHSGFHSYYWNNGDQNQFGKFELTYLDNNGWVVNGQASMTQRAGSDIAGVITHSGYIGLTSALDRVQLKIKDGTTTYNANSEATLFYMG